MSEPRHESVSKKRPAWQRFLAVLAVVVGVAGAGALYEQEVRQVEYVLQFNRDHMPGGDVQELLDGPLTLVASSSALDRVLSFESITSETIQIQGRRRADAFEDEGLSIDLVRENPDATGFHVHWKTLFVTIDEGARILQASLTEDEADQLLEREVELSFAVVRSLGAGSKDYVPKLKSCTRTGPQLTENDDRAGRYQLRMDVAEYKQLADGQMRSLPVAEAGIDCDTSTRSIEIQPGVLMLPEDERFVVLESNKCSVSAVRLSARVLKMQQVTQNKKITLSGRDLDRLTSARWVLGSRSVPAQLTDQRRRSVELSTTGLRAGRWDLELESVDCSIIMIERDAESIVVENQFEIRDVRSEVDLDAPIRLSWNAFGTAGDLSVDVRLKQSGESLATASVRLDVGVIEVLPPAGRWPVEDLELEIRALTNAGGVIDTRTRLVRVLGPKFIDEFALKILQCNGQGESLQKRYTIDDDPTEFIERQSSHILTLRDLEVGDHVLHIHVRGTNYDLPFKVSVGQREPEEIRLCR